MNQFNVQRVEFQVLEPVESRGKLSKDTSKSSRIDLSREASSAKADAKGVNIYSQRASSREKLGISRKFTNEIKTGVDHSVVVANNPVVPTKKPPIERVNMRIDHSPVALGHLPEKRISSTDAGGIQQREKVAKLPLTFTESEEEWNFSTSGIKRDLLRIAQDEEISEYRAKMNAVPVVRPSSVVEARGNRRTEEKGMISQEDLTGYRGERDLKEYKLCKYESGFEVLLVSTKCLVEKQKCENPVSAVGLCVGVGSFKDPKEAEGIAHFLEHMLFMGSERYPDENEYDSFITSHGGSCNAMTEGEYTVYQFVGTSKPEPFAKSLDIFAQCVQTPLLLPSCATREVNAIESEFILAKNDDGSRIAQLYSTCATNNTPEPHVVTKFDWGNIHSLKTVPEQLNIDINVLLREFYETNYKPNGMKLVVMSPMDFDNLQSLVEESFSCWCAVTVPTKKLSATTLTAHPVPNNGNHVSKKAKLSGSLEVEVMVFPHLNNSTELQKKFPYKFYCKADQQKAITVNESLIKLVRIVPIKQMHRLTLKFQMPSILPYYRQKLETYYGHLLGHEGEHSIVSVLKKMQLACGISAGVGSENKCCNTHFSIFEVTVKLTKKGVSNWMYVVNVIYAYIAELRILGPQEWIFDELKRMADIEYDNLDEDEEDEYVENMAINMFTCPPGPHRTQDLLPSSYKFWEYCPESLVNYLSFLTPDNARIELTSSLFQLPGQKANKSEDESDAESELESDGEDSEDSIDSDISGSESDSDSGTEGSEEGQDDEGDAVNLCELYCGVEQWKYLVEKPWNSPPGADAIKEPLIEKHFEVKYYEDLIPADMLQMWETIIAGEGNPSERWLRCISESKLDFIDHSHSVVEPVLYIPGRNPYVPTELNLIKTQVVECYPQPSSVSLLFDFYKHWGNYSFSESEKVVPKMVLGNDETPGFHCWHLHNPTYSHLPKIDLRLTIYSKAIGETPLSIALTQLLCSVLTEYLTESDLYSASICGLEGYMGAQENVRIELSVQGYSSDKAFSLLYALLDTLTNTSIMFEKERAGRDAMKNAIKSQYELLLRGYLNHNMSASSAAQTGRMLLLDGLLCPAADKHAALLRIKEDSTSSELSDKDVDRLQSMLAQQVHNILQASCAAMFIHGNCTSVKAIEESKTTYLKLVKASGNAASDMDSAHQAGLCWSNYPLIRTTKIRNCEALERESRTTGSGSGKNKSKSKKNVKVVSVEQFHCIQHVVPTNPLEENVSVQIYYQLHPPEGVFDKASDAKLFDYFREYVYIGILEEVLSEPFFDTLRTQQQLGYTVNCGYKNTYGILGFNFNVVSSTYSYAAIEKALFNFINKNVCFELLPQMPLKLFEQYVRSHIIKLSNRIQPSLVTAGDLNYFHHIIERNFGFGLNDNVASFLKQEYNIDGDASGHEKHVASTNPIKSTKTVEDLKSELIAFALKLFRLGSDVSEGNNSILIVRAYVDEINAVKKGSVSPPSTKTKQKESSEGGDKNKCNMPAKKRFCTCKSRPLTKSKSVKNGEGTTYASGSFEFCGVCEQPKRNEIAAAPNIIVHEHIINDRCGFIAAMGVYPALL